MKIIKPKHLLGAVVLLSQLTLNAQWQVNGNGTPAIGPTQFLGTINNESLRIRTTNLLRMKLNHSLNYAVDAQPATARDGFLLIGQNNNSMSDGTPLYNRGAFSLLHLNGEGTVYQEFGYRNWMRTGITFTGNRDLSYFGIRKLSTNSTEEDFTESTITWTDNSGNPDGPDDFVFRFVGLDNADKTTVSTNYTTNGDLDGLHIARFTPTGLMGLGNTFGLNATGMNVGYVRPQNLLHMSLNNNNPVFLQVTNQSGTGQTASDGLQIGLPTTSASNLEAQINQRENDRLSLFTNNGERIRITHIGALNNGVGFNPGNLPANRTRIGISHNPANPVTRPLSLLHLGYNTETAIPNENGWRPWMDVGMYVSQESDHIYLGIKDEGEDRKDAVISWGDNQVNMGPLGAGPDNLRMIFTSTPFAGANGTPPATGADGLEGIRLTPTPNNGVFTGIGGDPTSNLYFGNSTNPTATLEVNAWGGGVNNSGLRFTNLTSAATPITNPGQGVLSVNPQGDVIYVPHSSQPAIGNYCNATPQPLTDYFEVPLNDFNYYFTGQGTTPDINNIGSSVGIGLPCGDPIPYAKLHVLQTMFNPTVNNASTAGYFENNSSGAEVSFGIYAVAHNDAETTIGGKFDAFGNSVSPSQLAIGTWGYASTALDMNVGVAAEGYDGDFNYGVYARADTGTQNIAVYGYAPNNTGFGLHYAGVFDGDVLFNSDVIGSQFGWTASDSTFKNKIAPVANGMDIIKQLKPKTYFFDTTNKYGIRFSDKLQYGFISQEVEKILPDLVKVVRKPATRDLNGNTIHPAIDYKAMNYAALFGITVAAIQEQQAELAAKTQAIQNLEGRLAQLESCMNNLQLCNHSTNKTAPENPDGADAGNAAKTNAQHIKLTDPQTLVLNQNVPNPFAERTSITYTLPKEVQSAKIIFHNQDGRLVNSVELTERGNGLLHVYADDLSSGVYTYTLIADEKVIDTKKMIKQ